MKKYLIAGVIVGAALVGIGTALIIPFEEREAAPVPVTFALPNYSGDMVALGSFKGKPVIVTFWASWCPACAGELAILAGLGLTFPEDIVVIGVNRAEPLSVAEEYSEPYDPIVFVLDPEDTLYKATGGYAMPETLFFDSDGVLIHHNRTPLSQAEAHAHVEAMLSD